MITGWFESETKCLIGELSFPGMNNSMYRLCIARKIPRWLARSLVGSQDIYRRLATFIVGSLHPSSCLIASWLLASLGQRGMAR